MVMKVLASEGWLCASRRHIGGAGDILAVRARPDMGRWDTPPHVWCEAWLIEVKSTTRSPWVTFGPDDRKDLLDTAQAHGCEPWLYWWKPRGQLERIPGSLFPPDKRTNPQSKVQARDQ
jgi:hypothetical protein